MPRYLTPLSLGKVREFLHALIDERRRKDVYGKAVLHALNTYPRKWFDKRFSEAIRTDVALALSGSTFKPHDIRVFSDVSNGDGDVRVRIRWTLTNERGHASYFDCEFHASIHDKKIDTSLLAVRIVHNQADITFLEERLQQSAGYVDNYNDRLVALHRISEEFCTRKTDDHSASIPELADMLNSSLFYPGF